MSKLYKSSDYVEDMAREAFSNAGLENYITLNVISTSKAKDVIKVSKASPETEFLTSSDGMVTITVYEEALEALDEHGQKLLMEGAVSCIDYDSEKDKIIIDKSELNLINRMRHKYNNDVLDIFEQGAMSIIAIEEKEKDEKEAAKAEKMAKKASKVN